MSQYVTFEYQDGSKYCGESENNMLHGCGLLVEASNKGVFEGLWEKGSRLSGVYTFSQGKRYVGDWKGSFRSGLGVETWPDGTKYSGEYSENAIGPFGVLSVPTHGLYFGMWDSTGVQEGDGVEAYADGGFYRGQYKNGQRSGYGTRSSAGYEEERKEALKSSHKLPHLKMQSSASISMIHASHTSHTLKKSHGGHSADNLHDGSKWNQIYEGEWINDMRCGHGILKVSDCFTYYGQWKENTRTGYGVVVYDAQKSERKKSGRREEIKEEGRWDNGKLVEPVRYKNLEVIKSGLQKRVEEARTEAIKAATQAKERAKVAETRANAAAAKSKLAEMRAHDARQHAENACKGVENAARVAGEVLEDTCKIKAGVKIVIDKPQSEPPKAHVGCLDTSCSYQQLAAENDVIKSQAHGWSIAATSSFHNMQDVQALGVDTTRGSRGSGASAKKK